jgi:hypothetical protein
MEIVVKTLGGLGNQLFQYAAGRCLANRYGASLLIAPEMPLSLARDNPRRMLLPKFAIRAPVRELDDFDRLMTSTRPLLTLPAYCARLGRRIQVIRQSPQKCLFHQELETRPDTRTAYVVGYWQDYSIVQQVETDLRREIWLLDPLDGKNLEVAMQIHLAEWPVSIHLRRGDYASFFGSNMQLSAAYYERAVARMLSVNRRASFFVFSDDAGYAHRWVRDRPRMTVVDHNVAADAHEDLRLMSLCRSHIIANSTFSWWAAWLNTHPGKSVIAPADWLGHRTDSTAIAAPDWELLAA